MINKRYKRDYRPQEKLRQFSLNNSKGIDETKPITDVDTVIYTKNLVSNLDGTLSIRKPLVVRNKFGTRYVKVFHTHDPEVCIGITAQMGSVPPTLELFNSKTNLSLPLLLKATSYSNVLWREYLSSVSIKAVDFSELNVTSLTTATVLSNCKVNYTKLKDIIGTDPGADTDIINSKLYDDVNEPLPRYLQIYYAEDAGTWVVEIKSPEVNTLTTAEGESSLNANLTLDNPYAIRDTYKSTVPSIKGIVAYVPSKIENGKAVYDASDHSGRAAITNVTTASGSEQYTDGNVMVCLPNSNVLELSARVSSTYTSTSTGTDESEKCQATFEMLPTGADFQYSGTVGWQLDATLTPGFYVVDGDSVPVYLKYEDAAQTIQVSGVVRSSSELRQSIVSAVGQIATQEVTYAHGDEYSVVGALADLEIKVSLKLIPVSDMTVAELTESCKLNRYRPISVFGTCPHAYLKAFCNLPSESTRAESAAYYCSWFKSVDGVDWQPVNSGAQFERVNVREVSDEYVATDVEGEDTTVKRYRTVQYCKMSSNNELDNISERLDVIAMPDDDKFVKAVQYMFKIIGVEPLNEDDKAYDTELGGTQYTSHIVYSAAIYNPVFRSEFEFLETDLGNAASGSKLYYKKAIYSYGDSAFKNNILVSDVGSFITPLYNTIDIDATDAASVTSLIAWRDYLISSTESAMYLHRKEENGYFSKTLTTSVGIPASDSKCCKSILNGIIFKSGPKVYQMYPNVYSGDDTVLTLTEISKPVQDLLYNIYVQNENYDNFAIVTSDEYILMIPTREITHCLRYDFSNKVWTYCEYPVRAYSYLLTDAQDVSLYGYPPHLRTPCMCKYTFDADVDSAERFYGDVLEDGSESRLLNSPIKFEFDTGQKTDSVSNTKQFVESKLVFATLDERDSFPFTLYVAVDGDPRVTTMDVSTDAPFWKPNDFGSNDPSKGVLNTNIRLGGAETPATGAFNTLRQLVVRYSGKGKSIRHVIQGESVCNFKLYETYIRYKNINGK